MMLYFDHDTSASTDPKIMQLRLECGGAAVDAYWYLVEQMHRDERGICMTDARAMRVHCHTLCTDENTFKTWVDSMFEIGLLTSHDDGESMASERAMENIEKYQEKREKARSAAKAKWSNANAEQPQSERNANKRKEKKRNSSNATKSITTTDTAVAAAAAKAAPPADQSAIPHCPMCNVPAWKDSMGVYHCDCCHDTFERDKVGWR